MMRTETMLDSPGRILMSMMKPFNALQDDVLGIGYSDYFYAAYNFKDEHMRMRAVEGETPTTETIAGGSYPLITVDNAVIRASTDKDPLAQMLRD